MTPHEEGKAAAAARKSAWDNPYPTGTDQGREWARGHGGKPTRAANGRAATAENPR